MNLFLASYRFEKPLTLIYRMALPFLGILAIGVLLIAYIPKMTTWHLDGTSSQPEINWDEVEPATAGGGLDLPDNIDLMQELMADDDTPAAGGGQKLTIPDGVNLLDELNAPDEPTTEPPTAAPTQLEIPEGANLLDELNSDDGEDGGG